MTVKAAEAEAETIRARAALTQAEQALRRVRTLREQNAKSARDLEEAELAQRKAEAAPLDGMIGCGASNNWVVAGAKMGERPVQFESVRPGTPEAATTSASVIDVSRLECMNSTARLTSRGTIGLASRWSASV